MVVLYLTLFMSQLVRNIHYYNINICLYYFPFYYYVTGVYLALRNQFIANNTQIHIRSIGVANSALKCITDKSPCCYSQNPRSGEWYLPSGMLVPGTQSLTDMTFYRHRGDNGEVFLNRPTNVSVSPTGRFCCEVPDATNINQTLCVIIGKLNQH